MSDPDQHVQPVKDILDVVGLVAVAGTIWGQMPNIAAALAVAWYIFRFVGWVRAYRGRK
jgi:hypothetical protein